MGRHRKTQAKQHGSKAKSTKQLSQVRIIGGRWRGSKLIIADQHLLRPSTDRVRETLFNWLANTLNGRSCLDLFAGSGALGLEASSRGASEVTLVELHAESFQLLCDRVATLEASEMVKLVNADAHVWIEQQFDCLSEKNIQSKDDSLFDLVFLDPPFDYQNYQQLILKILPLLSPQALIYLETDHQINLPLFAGLSIVKQKTIGQVAMSLYQVVQ